MQKPRLSVAMYMHVSWLSLYGACAVIDRENMSQTVKEGVKVCVWHDDSDAAPRLDLDSCLHVTPAAPASLINRTDEDRLLLRRDGERWLAFPTELLCVFLHAHRLQCPRVERGKHDANLQGFLPTQIICIVFSFLYLQKIRKPPSLFDDLNRLVLASALTRMSWSLAVIKKVKVWNFASLLRFSFTEFCHCITLLRVWLQHFQKNKNYTKNHSIVPLSNVILNLRRGIYLFYLVLFSNSCIEIHTHL